MFPMRHAAAVEQDLAALATGEIIVALDLFDCTAVNKRSRKIARIERIADAGCRLATRNRRKAFQRDAARQKRKQRSGTRDHFSKVERETGQRQRRRTRIHTDAQIFWRRIRRKRLRLKHDDRQWARWFPRRKRDDGARGEPADCDDGEHVQRE